MKPYLFIAAFAILSTAGTVNAQKSVQKSYLGVKGGYNHYSMRNGNTSPYRYVPGFHAGLLGHLHLSRHFAFQPELVYSVQGAQIGPATDLNKTTANRVLTLTYINAPLLMQFMFNNGLRLQAGPQFGVLTTAVAKNSGETSNLRGEYRTLDVAAVAGISYVHPPSGFGADVRYNLGLREINAFHGTLRTFNQGLQVGLFYVFAH